MTLPELAALAVEKVPGFKRPAAAPCECGGVGFCTVCIFSDDDDKWDNSPAALLMAVSVLPGHSVEKHPGRLYVAVSCESGVWGCDHDGTSEGIARAALVALLRAHGVEVSDG